MLSKKLIGVFLTICTSMFPQIGGLRTFSFLDLPIPARSCALGGSSIAIWDKDVNLGYSNPALFNTGCSRQLAMNYVNYVADLGYGNVSFANQIKKHGVLGIGLQFFNYGKFDGRDEFNLETNQFSAADYALNVSFAKTLNKDSTLSLGVALKTIYSNYDIYHSFGNAIDVGLTYHNKKDLTVSLVAKNYGKQWKPYFENSPTNDLPTNVQFGVSKKVPKAPFRIIAQYDYLLKWDLTYNDPRNVSEEIDPFTNQPIVKTKTELRRERISNGFNKFGRHLTIGTEMLMSKNFTVRMAYNFRKGMEMALPEVKKANGLSLGFGLKVFKIQLDYAFSKYALTGNVHTLGLTGNLNHLSKK